MSSQQRKDLQSEGSSEAFRPHPDTLHIAEEDPKHPNHAEHVTRVDPKDPENIALVASIRNFGWPKARVLPIYRDGEKYYVGDGRRALTALRVVNAELKKAADPRWPIRPYAVICDDPVLATVLLNEMRKPDPPLVRVRRFLELRTSFGEIKAAAALGLTLKEAHDLTAIVNVPVPELHEAVNNKTIPSDLAARAAKKGSGMVRTVLEKAKEKSGGKIDKKAVRAAVKEEVPKRARGLDRYQIDALIDGIENATDEDGRARVFSRNEVARLFKYTMGDGDAVTGKPYLVAITGEALEAAKEARRAAK